MRRKKNKPFIMIEKDLIDGLALDAKAFLSTVEPIFIIFPKRGEKMRRLSTILLFAIVVFFATVAQAEYLEWDACTDATGYTVYYTDQTTAYNYNVGDQCTCEMDVLNLAFGVEYSFAVRAFNDAGPSESSNTVVWINEAYNSPTDVLPPIVITIPGPVTITIGQ